jgi:pimeloyl-ACP methyl ester carboxylesterase
MTGADVMTEADLLTRMLHAVDALDWDTVRGALAGELLVDYTSLAGGKPETLPGVSHFAPLQRPARFNAALLAFLDGLPGRP